VVGRFDAESQWDSRALANGVVGKYTIAAVMFGKWIFDLRESHVAMQNEA
jgi:hypothetical protein